MEVVNLWINRLIENSKLPFDGIKNNQWPDWVKNKEKSPGGRNTFTNNHFYENGGELVESGLLSPVLIKTWAD